MYQPEAPSQLANAMYEVPHLAQQLFSDSAAPLAGCSRQLRRLIHSSTQQVTLSSEHEISQVVKSNWPQLSVVMCNMCSSKWPEDGKLKLVGSFQLSQEGKVSTAFIVRPTEGQSQTHMQHSPLTTAMHLLASPHGKDSATLFVTGYHFDAASVAQLTSLGWSRLSELSILVDKLDTATASCIITGSWPVLHFLHLGTDRWDFAATRILTDHQWPSLCELVLQLGTQSMTFEFELGVDDMPQLHRLTCQTCSLMVTPCLSWLLRIMHALECWPCVARWPCVALSLQLHCLQA